MIDHWIVYRVVIDNRAATRTRARPVGWLRADDEEQAMQRAKKWFLGTLRVRPMDGDYGWFE
jgi:hypothetical protein